MINDAWHVTAVHEAGHAVISHVLGRSISHAVLHDESRGEVVPNCSFTDDEMMHYETNNPDSCERSRGIQENICCDCGIAVAGLIAEQMICGDTQISEQELQRDRKKGWNCAAYLHYWSFGVCENTGEGRGGNNCRACNEILAKMDKVAKQIIAKPNIKDSIERLAGELQQRRQLSGEEIKEFLEEQEVKFGSEVEGFLSSF